MGQTLAEKIISAHTEHPVKAGDLCIAKVDVTAVQDGTGPLTISEFKLAYGYASIRKRNRRGSL